MWHCPKCIKPQTLLDQALQYQGFWEQSYFVPYTQLYQHTSVAYRGLEIGLFFHGGRCRVTVVRVEPIAAKKLECTCGATVDVTPLDPGKTFFVMTQFFKKVLKPLPSPRILSVDSLVTFTEKESTIGKEELVRTFVLRNIRHSYLDKRGEEQWLLWYKP